MKTIKTYEEYLNENIFTDIKDWLNQKYKSIKSKFTIINKNDLEILKNEILEMDDEEREIMFDSILNNYDKMNKNDNAKKMKQLVSLIEDEI
jgi:uncharacterized protein YaaW (UPF0174 family)